MPKKRAPKYEIKPSSPAHPSLSSSAKPKDASHSLGSHTDPAGNSVNDRIQRLRISQGVQKGRGSPDVFNPGSNPSLPPSLRSILQLPDAPQPRPRPGLRVARRVRGPAGPVPPSWLIRRDRRTNTQAKLATDGRGVHLPKHERLPGSCPPKAGSLIDISLKALAQNWDWHVYYDQHYLATIPARYKQELLYYIRCYRPQGINKAGLEVLFLDETELEDATGAEGLTHLDLTSLIGNSLTLNELKQLFSVKKALGSTNDGLEDMPESWDAPEIVAQPSGLPRFHSLTHLSLSHPNHTAASWKALLDFAPYLATLTHLSLAYWPTPTLSPNSSTAYRETPQGRVNYGASNFYSAYDDDWSEAASILRRLGKLTYCLKWLDLSGCYPWVRALDLLDWVGVWQALQIVKINQGWIPECCQEEADQQDWKNIFYKPLPQAEPPSEVAIRRTKRDQLISWAANELDTMRREAIINARISLSMNHMDSPDNKNRQVPSLQSAEDEWNETRPERASGGPRYTKVVFERGWHARWIKEAIEQINDRVTQP